MEDHHHHVFNHSTSNYKGFCGDSSSIPVDHLREYNTYRYDNISVINSSRDSQEPEFAGKRTFDETNIINRNIKNKKMKMASNEQLRSDIQFQTHIVMTERKGQKLSDKITALQKLVSPYGKTDTASVLEEAIISIMDLQIQIKNMSLMFMSNNHVGSQPKSEGGDETELQRMGLCLVPLSSIHSKYNIH